MSHTNYGQADHVYVYGSGVARLLATPSGHISNGGQDGAQLCCKCIQQKSMLFRTQYENCLKVHY